MVFSRLHDYCEGYMMWVKYLIYSIKVFMCKIWFFSLVSYQHFALKLDIFYIKMIKFVCWSDCIRLGYYLYWVLKLKLSLLWLGLLYTLQGYGKSSWVHMLIAWDGFCTLLSANNLSLELVPSIPRDQFL